MGSYRRMGWGERTGLACVVVLCTLLLVGGEAARAADEAVSLKLTTAKGEAVVIENADVDLGDNLLWQAVAGWTPSFEYLETLVLRSAEGVYFAIPAGFFTEARLVQGRHVITLADGQQLKGKLIGAVKEKVEEGQKAVSYPLSSAVSIKVIGVPRWEREEVERTKARKIQPAWIREVELGPPGNGKYAVFSGSLACLQGPRFSRVMESDWPKTTAIYLSPTGGDAQQTSLGDYSELAFERRPQGMWATFRYKGGTEKSGTFAMKVEGESGLTSDCLLVATLADNTGIKIVLRGASFTLRHEGPAPAP